jgi:hypothetical protein
MKKVTTLAASTVGGVLALLVNEGLTPKAAAAETDGPDTVARSVHPRHKAMVAFAAAAKKELSLMRTEALRG